MMHLHKVTPERYAVWTHAAGVLAMLSPHCLLVLTGSHVRMQSPGFVNAER
jgi:hypothetical protein